MSSNITHTAKEPSNVVAIGPPTCFQVNKKFRKFERKYRDYMKRKGDKIGTQTCYDIST